jgi:2-(1,2-epoxy-1,2-dihydrophenyl)acetyl-CoA isomerase
MEFQDILLKKEDGVAIVTLNRPETLNALSLSMREGLATVFEGFRSDDTVRAVVLTGAGRAFCAGGDVKGMADARSSVDMRDFIRGSVHRAVKAMATLEKPVIAMVNGVAVGAGCSIVMACDLIIASEAAKFGQAFIRVGLSPDWGGAYFLPRLVGPAKAKELLFTGKLIDAREAERIGLVNQVVPPEELEPTVISLARQLAQGPTKAIGIAKMLVTRGLELDLGSLLDYEAYAAAVCVQTEDHHEGVRAFIEKRPPVFKGR